MITIRYIKYLLHYFINRILGIDNHTRNQLENWLKLLDIKTDRVLDVGVGFEPVYKRVGKWRVKKYRTLDNNLENHVSPNFELDLNLIESKNNKNIAKKIRNFLPNNIFCLEVMEYIYNPMIILRFFHQTLAKNGILYISFHTFYPYHKPYRADYLRYTKSGITKLLKEAGFSKWEITPRLAKAGKKELLAFFKKEGMLGFRDKINLEIGYMIKAYK
ncbi:MAG: hypothetical protein WC894_02290 [Patescibacteria group bacterium]